MNNKQIIIGAQLTLARNGASTYSALAGTIAIAEGGSIVTGTGTAFNTALVLGDLINIGGIDLPIAEVTDATHITLDDAYTGETLTAATGYKRLAALVSSTNKPTSAAPNWAAIGEVLNDEVKNEGTDLPIVTGTGGPYRRTNILRTSTATDIMVVTESVNELVLESVLQSGAIVNGTAFAPGSSIGQIRGWWRFQKRAQNGALILDIHQYGIAVVKAVKAENKNVTPQWDISVLYNALATGTSTLASAE